MRPFAFLPLKWILNFEASLHSLQHVKIEFQNCVFFSDLSAINTKFFFIFQEKTRFGLNAKADFLTQSSHI